MGTPEVKRYSYKGPVCEFGRVIASMWTAETSATSARKAKSNLAYRFKRDNNKIPTTKIELPGKVVVVE
jgi:hypothetical protein